MTSALTIEECIADTKYLARCESLPVVDCALFGQGQRTVKIVPVALRPSDPKILRPIDAVFSLYVNTVYDHMSNVQSLEESVTEIDQWPLGVSVRAQYSYTIFTSNNVCEFPNHAVSSLRGPEVRGFKIRGAVLVAQSHILTGAIEPVTEGDLFAIERMLVDVLGMAQQIMVPDGLGANQLGLNQAGSY